MAGSQEPHRIQGVPSAGSSGRNPALTTPAGGTASSSERLVNDLILKAFRAGASDLHLEPFPDHLLVRARIDGVLQPLEKVPGDQMKQAISRLKIMSNLDTGESRTPTDGRFNFARYEPTAKELDVRATFLPTFFGEKAVLRLVDHSKLKMSLEELGFTPESSRLYTAVAGKASGIVLHVGPQGSGKTTTAYGGLKNVPRQHLSLVTVEEMIEYVIPGVTQVQLHPDQGLVYKNAIQGVLRQDPDVILVGEMKDAETARVAIEAAMSGRLVLTTLHATSAAKAVDRLVELGFSRPQVAHSLAGVVSQRLVRRLCPDCRERVSPSTLIRSALVLPPTAQAVYKAKGCRKCGTKGYRGRVAVFEVVSFSDRMREAAASGATAQQLDGIAVAEGTVPLLRDAVEKTLRGDTSVEEILRTLIGVAVEDVGAITEPGEMVNFLKTVRDQFLPPVPAAPSVAPSSGAIALPATLASSPRQTTSIPRQTQSFPAAMMPSSGRYKLPEDVYGAMASAPPAPTAYGAASSSSPPPASAYGMPTPPPVAASGRDPRTASSEDLLRTIVSSLPPEVAANLARAAQQASAPPSPPQQPQPAPRSQTTTLSPELLRQLQELQKRLNRDH